MLTMHIVLYNIVKIFHNFSGLLYNGYGVNGTTQLCARLFAYTLADHKIHQDSPNIVNICEARLFQGHLKSVKIPPKKKRNKNPKPLRVQGTLHLLWRKTCCPLFTGSCPLKDTCVKQCPRLPWVLSTPPLHEQGKLSSPHQNWVMHLAQDLGPPCQLLSPHLCSRHVAPPYARPISSTLLHCSRYIHPLPAQGMDPPSQSVSNSPSSSQNLSSLVFAPRSIS